MKTNHYNRFFLLLGCLLIPLCGMSSAETATGNRLIPAAEAPRIPGLDKFKLYQNQYGHILCENESIATSMLATLDQAEKNFTAVFDKPPGKGLFYQDRSDIADAAAKLGPALHAAWVAPAPVTVPAQDASVSNLPILSAAELEGIKQQFKEQTKIQMPGITEEMFEKSFKSSLPGLLAQMGARLAPEAVIDAAPLGKKFFTAAYRPGSSSVSLPVWLGEVAAEVASNSAEARRDRIGKLASTSKDLLPVEKLVTATTTAGDSFKIQALALATFLAETSGRPAILGNIASTITAGRPFSTWFATNGRDNKLGADLTGLNTTYQTWLKSKGRDAGVSTPPVAPVAKSLNPGAKVTPDAIVAADFIQGEGPKEWEQDKLYFIECWATWCAPCVQIIPQLNEHYKTYKDRGLRVIGMNVMEDGREKVAGFVKNKGEGMSYPVAYDSMNGRFQTEWLTPSNQRGIPHVYVVRNGELLFHCHPGLINKSMIEKLLVGGPQADAVVNTMRSKK